VRKVALVTGGAVRVGRALSLGLAEAGFDVAVHYHTSGSAAREVERRITGLGRRALLLPGDLSHGEDAERVVRGVETEFGRLDLLVNSAASFHARPILEVDEEEWDDVMAVNLKGPFLLVRAAAALLREGRGSVVNLLDLSAIQPWTTHPHHSVAKAGLLHLTRVLARALAPEVRVNAIAPGTVLPPASSGEAELERDRSRTPLGHQGNPQDVVRSVLFLAGSPFMTGEVLLVDGGRHLSG